MGFFSKAAAFANPITAATGLGGLMGGSMAGMDMGTILGSGIPFIGDNIAAQQQQQFSAQQTQASRDFNANEAVLSRNFNQEESRKNRHFQSRMSNSAHQREVKDLRKAGLNPILSAGGPGASTASGSAATSGPASASAAAGVAGSGAKDAAKLMQSMYTLEKQKSRSQIENVKASTGKTKTEDKILKSQEGEIKSRSQKNKQYQDYRNHKLDYILDKLFQGINKIPIGAHSQQNNKRQYS